MKYLKKPLDRSSKYLDTFSTRGILVITMLSERQVRLLEAIISEYLSSSEPVGSALIVKKYNLSCSAATIRNEMAKLLEQGYLDMLHTSSGRVPTPMAYRFFLTELLDEEELPVLKEVAIKQRLWPKRFQYERLLKEAALALSEVTNELAFATADLGFVATAGAVNVLDYPEFFDLENAKSILYLADRYELLEKILKKGDHIRDVTVLVGDELGIEGAESASIVFSKYSTGQKSGFVGVLGPSRTNYGYLIPSVRYVRNLVEELSSAW